MPRLDALFIDYLGAADTPYTRAVTRKAFTAAVACAMMPGSKYDNMLILAGFQGLGKISITLSAVNILKYFRWQVSKVLVVAPWQKEAARWDHLRHLRISTVLGSTVNFIQHEIPVMLDAKAGTMTSLSGICCWRWTRTSSRRAPPGSWWENFCSIATELSTTMTAKWSRSMAASWRPMWSCWSSLMGSIA